MQKDEKGFTLIELIAVLVILTIIMSIAIPSISASIERSKDKQKNSKISIIESAAELYATDRRGQITSSSCYIKLDQIKQAGLLDDDEIVNPVTNENFTGCVLYNKSAGTYQYQDSCGSNYCIS